MACQTHFLYLLLRLSFFQSSMLNNQGPWSYGTGWRVEPPPTTSSGFFQILNLQFSAYNICVIKQTQFILLNVRFLCRKLTEW